MARFKSSEYLFDEIFANKKESEEAVIEISVLSYNKAFDLFKEPEKEQDDSFVIYQTRFPSDTIQSSSFPVLYKEK